MQLDNEKIKSVLLTGGYVSEEDISRALEYAALHDASVTDALFALGLTRKDLLGQAMAESYGIQYIPILNNPPQIETILKIPEEIARTHGVICFSEENAKIFISTYNPEKQEMRDALQKIFPDREIMYSFAFPEDLERLFLVYRKPLETRFADIVATGEKIAPEITDEIMRDALDYKASDIHFEPQGGNILVRFRIDGVLYQAGLIPSQYYGNILNRIKIMAHVRVDEHHTSQDGAIRYESKNGITDIRVSIVPTISGEKIAMRLLAKHVNVSTFNDIGLSLDHQKILNGAIRKPAGMIVVSGPTGSGKTTTLYTILNALNTPDQNITTIEDPVEYKLRGINQIQVDVHAGLTFANGLRSIVRQDPNIILVGEIRDRETAEISANAALTGHLLLSTFHAIDTASTITRLLHMGVESTILASTVELIITQRLVRKICEACRVGAPTHREEFQILIPHIEQYFPQESVMLFRGKGCNACGGIGYLGRTGIYEFMPMSQDTREAIIQSQSITEIKKLAYASGTRTMFDDGIEKVKNGTTTIEELLRVAPPQR